MKKMNEFKLIYIYLLKLSLPLFEIVNFKLILIHEKIFILYFIISVDEKCI